jgi:hypothetical protein
MAHDELQHYNEQSYQASGAIQAEAESEGASLMDIVTHINRGQLIATDPIERWRYAELNCYLSHRAREATAFGPALTMSLYGSIFMGPPRRLLVSTSNVTPDLIATSSLSAATPLAEPIRRASLFAAANAQRHLEGIETKVAMTTTIATAMTSTRPSRQRQRRHRQSRSPLSSSDDDNADDDDIGNDDDDFADEEGDAVGPLASKPITTASDDVKASDNGDEALIQPPSNYDYDKSIPKEVWVTDDIKRKIAMRLYCLRLALEYANGNNDEADAFAPIAEARATIKSDLARLLVIRASSMIFRTNYPMATQYGLQALEALDQPMPPSHEWSSFADTNQQLIKERLEGRDVAAIVEELPPVATAEERLAAFLTAELLVLAYLSNPPMLNALATRSVLQSLDKGLTAAHRLVK